MTCTPHDQVSDETPNRRSVSCDSGVDRQYCQRTMSLSVRNWVGLYHQLQDKFGQTHAWIFWESNLEKSPRDDMDSKSASLWAQYYTSLDRMQFEQATYKILSKVFEKFPLVSFVFTSERSVDIVSVSTMWSDLLQMTSESFVF